MTAESSINGNSTPSDGLSARLSAPEAESGAQDVQTSPGASEDPSSLSDLVERLERLKARFADPLPSAEELAAGAAEDRALVPRIRAARPGVPAHHVLAVLETLRAIRHYEQTPDSPAAARGTCDASTVSPLGGLLGPCVLRHLHDGPVHKDADGARWTVHPA